MEQYARDVFPTVISSVLVGEFLVGSNHSTVGGPATFSSVTVQVRL